MADPVADLFRELEEQEVNQESEDEKPRKLPGRIRRKLLEFQHQSVIELANKLEKYFVALNASDTGTGKSYVSVAVAKILKRRPIFVTLKSVCMQVIKVLDYFKVDYIDVVNYETIRVGKTYAEGSFERRKRCPYLSKSQNVNQVHYWGYTWNVPRDAIVIFDEVHRCKDPSTDAGRLFMSTRQLINQKIPVMFLSATIFQDFMDMKIPFYLLGIIPNIRNFTEFVRSLEYKYPEHKTTRDAHPSDAEFKKQKDLKRALIIYNEIKPYASRIRIADLGDRFPENQVCCQEVIVENMSEIREIYARIDNIDQKLKQRFRKSEGDQLAERQKLLQRSEIHKVPIFIEQTKMYWENGKSVVIFVNYLDTLHLLAKELRTDSVIFGDQEIAVRHHIVENFQKNLTNIIISQVRAGGTGIDLHDVTGEAPRVSLISITDSSTDLIQLLGRIHRAGGKSPALQRIIILANIQYELRIMENINRKLSGLSIINDGHQSNYQIVTEASRKFEIKKSDSESEVDNQSDCESLSSPEQRRKSGSKSHRHESPELQRKSHSESSPHESPKRRHKSHSKSRHHESPKLRHKSGSKSRHHESPELRKSESKSRRHESPERRHKSGSKSHRHESPERRHKSGSKSHRHESPELRHKSGSKSRPHESPERSHKSGSKSSRRDSPERRRKSGSKSSRTDDRLRRHRSGPKIRRHRS